MQKQKSKNEKISISLKRHYQRQRTMSDVKMLSGIILTITTVSILIKIFTPTALADYSTRNIGLMASYNKKEITIIDKIIKGAQENNVEIKTALRIAHCESRFNPNAESKISSATGVYQFINKTWINYCKGERTNADDNIACFMKLYNKNPNWWACK